MYIGTYVCRQAVLTTTKVSTKLHFPAVTAANGNNSECDLCSHASFALGGDTAAARSRLADLPWLGTYFSRQCIRYFEIGKTMQSHQLLIGAQVEEYLGMYLVMRS